MSAIRNARQQLHRHLPTALSVNCGSKMVVPSAQRFFSITNPDMRSTQPHPHFRTSSAVHPLGIKKVSQRGADIADTQVGQAAHAREKTGRINIVNSGEIYKYDNQSWSLPMINHVWTPDEVEQRMARPHPRHTPVTPSDKFVYHVVKGLYRGFNWVSGYNYEDPTPKSCAYRIIMLESVAGVPGMVAGVVRHFSSLRTLQRDHGWIHTLLEESQNERMHLLVALRMFEAGLLTRASVFAGQCVLVPLLFGMYLVKPTMVHRLVGYLEEFATETYTSLVEKTSTPGTKLNKAWKGVPASSLARAYWNLPEDSEWLHVLEQILADETNHRDVNHTFADMEADDPNPYVEKHIKDFENMWRRDLTGLKGAHGSKDF